MKLDCYITKLSKAKTPDEIARIELEIKENVFVEDDARLLSKIIKAMRDAHELQITINSRI